jgi:hypothetical protein
MGICGMAKLLKQKEKIEADGVFLDTQFKSSQDVTQKLLDKKSDVN